MTTSATPKLSIVSGDEPHCHTVVGLRVRLRFDTDDCCPDAARFELQEVERAVRAVNVHDSLVAALASAIDHLAKGHEDLAFLANKEGAPEPPFLVNLRATLKTSTI